jgi:transposase
MAAPAKCIEVPREDRAELERVVRSATEQVRMVERAQIVLYAAEGHSAAVIARMVGCATVTAQKWRSRYEREGMAGLFDLPRPGKPLTYSCEERARLIAKACTRPPDTPAGQRRERWSYDELAAEVGMSSSHAHTILARADVKPHLTDYWVMSDFTDPKFEQRLKEVCGLYVDPPENVLVVSIDEKTGIQAKAPTKPDTPAAPGKPPRREHEYVRNGTQCLFACLKVKEGDVLGMPSKTRNRHDLIRFLNRCDQEIPVVEGQQIVAVSDNLSTRRTEEGAGMAPRAPALALPVHSHARLVAEPGRDLLLDPAQAPAPARRLHLRARPRRADARLHRDLQPSRQTVQLDLHRQGTRGINQRIRRKNH